MSKKNLGKEILEDKLVNEVQIINGIKIRFRKFSHSTPNRLMMNENKKPIKDKSIIPKDWIKSYMFKSYMFNYVDNEFMYIKNNKN
jgi:hypothetical protein